MNEQQGMIKKMASTKELKPLYFVNDMSKPAIEDMEERTEHLVQELRSYLKDSKVLLPESEGYAESIKRWSDAVEMRAVCDDLVLADHFVSHPLLGSASDLLGISSFYFPGSLG